MTVENPVESAEAESVIVRNPYGRPPKGTTFRDLVRLVPIEKKRKMVDAMVDRAIAGNVRAFESLRDTLEGKPAVVVVNNSLNLDESPMLQALMAAQRQLGMRSVEQDGSPTPLP